MRPCTEVRPGIRARLRSAAALLALALLTGCAGLSNPVFEPPGVSLTELRLDQAGLFEQRFAVTLRVSNPNALDIPLFGIVYDLEIGGVGIGEGQARPDVRVPAYGDAEVGVTLTTSTLRLAELLRRWEARPPETVDYAVRGRVDLGGVFGLVPFTRTGEVPLLQR